MGDRRWRVGDGRREERECKSEEHEGRQKTPAN